ncbi:MULTISPECIES: acyl-CoA dehydrogenase C-terminal domain-containing protein [Kordiimonas]|jgi:alkylation response protein AidB-like acyl-CoA dehydrogenase|uniref:acyl-CoA dehydrogenase C-terminal domain-containing protein n=1 Tax=Kordiimonas TaxID=288021 RepID=UPI00257BAA53|nr:acyl-CoA dehydrogenase C-terminal domain-containing protein [Kordiimonas sp. UBA4487]
MTDYRAPLEEIRFALETAGGLADWTSIPAFEEAGDDLVAAILEEAGKLAGGEIAPTNVPGDQIGAKWTEEGVISPDVFKPMHQAYVEGGWSTLSAKPELGGQGLPSTLSTAVDEMVTSANMAYSLLPMLTSGAIEAIDAHGTDEQRHLYLPKMITGEWSGAMNLTEPSAGSDVGALRAKASRQADGSYLITGQKIFITWGDHDLADNVIHLVLARLPDAPAGTKGISMFLVPKVHVNADGSLGEPNDVKCVSIEHKLGIHASPTCVMSFGDNGNCVGYIVGEENRGMANMFTMMNHARISVGLEGVAIAERAYQHAASYALERVQSAAIGAKTRDSVTIINHPDVRRMLLTMRATAEASRAIIYRNVWALDRAHALEDAEARAAAKGEADLLTPISKAYSTDIGVEAASLGIQVYGGMGFVEETGVAQYYRDARIAPIYEGTNGIQALDLVGRKLNADGGAHWRALIAEMRDFAAGEGSTYAGDLAPAVDALEDAANTLFENGFDKIVDTAAAATPYLRLFGTVLGAYMLSRQAVEAEKRLAAGEGNPSFLKAKVSTAAFYREQILPSAVALLPSIKAGARHITDMAEEAFLRH